MDALERSAAAVSTERVVDLATLFCSVPTPRGEEGALAEIIADTLDRPGIDVHIEDVVAGRPNVIVTVPGDGDRRPLVLNGHMDASVHPGPWRRPPHEPWVENGRLYGGGITDMQGALAAMVAAVEAAPRMHSLPGDLVLHAVMHHDTIGLGAKYALALERLAPGYGICGEPSGLAIHTANGGAFKFEITFAGKTAHISRREEGADALAAAVETYRQLQAEKFEHEPCERLPDLPRLLVGELHAGVAAGAVADLAVLRGDLRSVPGMHRAKVREQLGKVAERCCGDGVSASVRITAVQQPFLGATSGSLVDTISAAHTFVRGEPPTVTNTLPGQAFVTDAADMAACGLETVVYGASEWRYAPDESVDVEELADSARIYLGVAAALV